ncbi:hypothetical protein J6590_012258 [Homalodisca vitripennis]|nr:hypothetical protein J6590_012258 [Homalodisca vitripennis]
MTGKFRAKKPPLTLNWGPTSTNEYRTTSNGNAGVLLANTGRFSGQPPKEQQKAACVNHLVNTRLLQLKCHRERRLQCSVSGGPDKKFCAGLKSRRTGGASSTSGTSIGRYAGDSKLPVRERCDRFPVVAVPLAGLANSLFSTLLCGNVY